MDTKKKYKWMAYVEKMRNDNIDKIFSNLTPKYRSDVEC